MKVTLIGAAGGIGQPLALLLKQDARIRTLALVDVAPTQGIAADLSHINTPASVTGHDVSAEGKAAALSGADVVVITAGLARRPGMSREDLFGVNAKILTGLAEACAEHCPGAFICIITNPVNAMVPLVKSVMERKGVYNPRKLFGVTTLDMVRASTFVAQSTGTDGAAFQQVPVVGGHSGTTIVPLLSGVEGLELDAAAHPELIHRIQFAGDEVVAAKEGKGSATLSMAHSAAVFVAKVVEALGGAEVQATAFVECDFVQALWPALGREGAAPECPFFSAEVSLTSEGVASVRDAALYAATISDTEKSMIADMLPKLSQTELAGLHFSPPEPEGGGKL